MIWEDWPALRTVALKLAWFISPFIEIKGSNNLLEHMLRKAIAVFRATRGEQRDKARAFLHCVQETADVLAGLRISVLDSEGHWNIWQYDEPLIEWMAIHKVHSVQIKPLARRSDSGPIALCLMGYVCTMRDLRMAGVGLGAEL